MGRMIWDALHSTGASTDLATEAAGVVYVSQLLSAGVEVKVVADGQQKRIFAVTR